LGGFYQLWDYSNGPGIPGDPPRFWPSESKLQREIGKPTLLVFAHPRCPCTRASFGELERILTHINDKVSTHVVFYHPKNFSADWVKADLWQTSQKMAVSSVSIDSDGEEIRHFRPKTSGQVYLYSADNRLIYSGGITGSRGHEGDNDGRTAILSWVLDKQLITPDTFVFGCSLYHNGEETVDSRHDHSEKEIGIIHANSE